MNFYILLFLSGFFASMTILTTIQIVNGISEDQVVVCINGNVIDKDAGLICREFMADYDHDRKISDIQQELYDNPDTDTFEVLTTTTINGGSD